MEEKEKKEFENQSRYVLKKHWCFWIVPIIISALLIPTKIFPIIILIWAFFRWNNDYIEYRDGCIYSRIGFINITRKAIHLEKISVVSERSNFISSMMNFGDVVIESSAANSTIVYNYIANVDEFIDYINDKLKNKQY